MKKRIKLQKVLLDIADEQSLSLYYQPPANVKMSYPCIVYEPIDGRTIYADNRVYVNQIQYQVTLITKNPDPEAFDAILNGIPYGSFRNKTVVDNLHNFVFYCYE